MFTANRVNKIMFLFWTLSLLGWYVTVARDPHKCNALRDRGEWLEPWSWRTPGCITHEYSAPDLAKCEGGETILFVGDVNVRDIFWATVRKVDADSKWMMYWQEDTNAAIHEDLEYYNSTNGIHLKFLWDPWLNSSALHLELLWLNIYGLREYDEAWRLGANFRDIPAKLLRDHPQKTVAMLIGGGHWISRHLKTSSLAVAQYQKSIDYLISLMGPEGVGDRRWEKPYSLPREGFGDRIFFAPVLEPRYERLTPSREASITPDKIDQMNHYLGKMSAEWGINVMWSYAKMTKGRPQAYDESGLHVVANVSSAMADVFTNLRCNSKAALREGYPFNRTCCTAYRGVDWFHTAMLSSALAILALVAVKLVRGRSPSMSPSTIPSAIITLHLAACYCFLADRTGVFEKSPLQYSNVVLGMYFGLALSILFVVIEMKLKSRHHQETLLSNGAERSTFLSRNQSNEFKGWIQVFALLYGYTKASDSLDFYEIMRIFVALYFFLSGYGHTMYFLQKQDYSFRRVDTVLMRQNLLAYLLSYVMYRPYSSYHFAPLASFWFLVVYTTLKVCSRKNRSLRFLLTKVLISVFVTSLLIHGPGNLEALSVFPRLAGVADGTVDEWRSRLAVDRSIVYVGMVVAALHIRIGSELKTGSDFARFATILRRELSIYGEWFPPLACASPGILFMLVSALHPNKEDYDWWFPYLSYLPVLSMVAARNHTQALRTYHSAGFALLGRMSLELYILSQHIWLAADGEGLLTLGYGGKLDTILLGMVLVWVAWKVSEATRTLIRART